MSLPPFMRTALCRILPATAVMLLAAGCTSGNFCAPAAPAVAPPQASYVPLEVIEGNTGTSAPVFAAGGGAPSSVTLQSTLPNGITMAADGTFQVGAQALAGLYSFQVQFRNAGGASLATAGITVVPQDSLAISYPPLTAQANHPITPQDPHLLNNFTNVPTTYEVTAGNFPPGLTLHTDTGIIDGEPTTPGDYPFTVTATNGPATHTAESFADFTITP